MSQKSAINTSEVCFPDRLSCVITEQVWSGGGEGGGERGGMERRKRREKVMVPCGE